MVGAVGEGVGGHTPPYVPTGPHTIPTHAVFLFIDIVECGIQRRQSTGGAGVWNIKDNEAVNDGLPPPADV